MEVKFASVHRSSLLRLLIEVTSKGQENEDLSLVGCHTVSTGKFSAVPEKPISHTFRIKYSNCMTLKVVEKKPCERR